ncbi:MAG: alpha/beta fold hydrolase [Dehalococcoidia bacterium]
MSDALLIALAVFGAVVVGLLALAIIGWFGSEKALKPPPYAEAESFAALAINPEEVTFPSKDGLRLNGYYLSGTNGAGLVLCHGYGRSHEEMIPHAAYLNREGFSCLVFDQRSRGLSEGKLVSIGAMERFDVMGAVDHLLTRIEVDPERIGIFGVSGGAAAALLATVEDTRLKAVVAEACYRNLRSVIATSFKHFTGLPAFPFANVTVKMAELRLGHSVDTLAPERIVAAIAPRPILFIHGEDDRAIACEASRHMHGLAGEPKELWMIPEAGHAKGLEVAGDEYERRVADFFRHYLVARRDSAVSGNVAQEVGPA